jgi:protein-disulfide isomerase
MEPLLQQLLEKYRNDIKLVFKNFPLPMHPLAPKAAVAALAAGRQDRFWEYHHKLFEATGSLSDEKFQSIARDLKLDMNRFNRDLNDPALQKIVQRDLAEAQQAEVPGTPTLFVNGKNVQFRSLQDIEQAIDGELSRKRGGADRKKP